MLSKSDVIISIRQHQQIIGFGRATSDGTFRATLWDIVVDKNHQTLGLGRQITKSILENSFISKAEKIYLMTTHSQSFYSNIGFQKEGSQTLMLFQGNKNN